MAFTYTYCMIMRSRKEDTYQAPDAELIHLEQEYMICSSDEGTENVGEIDGNW